jgi:hypothetical protein
MKIEFISRLPDGIERVVVTLTDDNQWIGDEDRIKVIKEELEQRNIDWRTDAGKEKIPYVFWGSYFWAAMPKHK